MNIDYLLTQQPTIDALALGPAELFTLRYVLRGIARPKGHPLIAFATAADTKMVEWEYAEWRTMTAGKSRNTQRRLKRRRSRIVHYAHMAAVRNGHLGIVRLLFKKKREFDYDLANEAVRYGQLHIVQYLTNDKVHRDMGGKKFEPEQYRKKVIKGPLFAFRAAKSGNLELIKWATSITKKFNAEEAACIAVGREYMYMLEWLVAEYPYAGLSVQKFAAQVGQFDALEILHKRRMIDSRAFAGAAWGGRIDVMKWLLSHGYEPAHDITLDATLNGQLEALEYLLSIGIEWHYKACENAAKYSVQTLEWALDHGAPWKESIADWADYFGRYDIVELVIRRGLPVSQSAIDTYQNSQ
jgi:hypothetical protein